MPLIDLLPILVVIGVVMSATWVHYDKVAQCQRGSAVTFSFGTFHLDTPGGWFGACLVLWLIFFPLYLPGRRQ